MAKKVQTPREIELAARKRRDAREKAKWFESHVEVVGIGLSKDFTDKMRGALKEAVVNPKGKSK